MNTTALPQIHLPTKTIGIDTSILLHQNQPEMSSSDIDLNNRLIGSYNLFDLEQIKSKEVEGM
jgi:hypothetical protein